MHFEKLDDLLYEAYRESSFDGNNLLKHIRSVYPKNIHWDRLQHLRIIGDDNADNINKFENAGIPRGFYLNADDSWLLILLPEKPQLKDYLIRGGQYLETLWLIYTQARSCDLGIMPNLRKLTLRDNRLLDNLGQLGKLSKLEFLFIFNCPVLSELNGLDELTNLTHLFITDCQSLSVLPSFDKLANLTYLNIFSCTGLQEIPSLDNLEQLNTLHITLCDSLTMLPALNELTQLTDLSISLCSNITQLSQMNELTNLTELDISYCDSLIQLPPLDMFQKLITLNISGCYNLKQLPDSIRHLKSLRKLVLHRLNLDDLPDWLPDIAEQFSYGTLSLETGITKANVCLYHTTVKSINDMSMFDQPYEMVAKWFRDRRAGESHPLNEIKVVFLGDGEAGKSHTIARLMNDGGEPDYAVFDGQSTPGIVIRNKDYDLKDYDLGDRKFQVHYWDFGGQEIMHSMHRIFLTGRTMYVILLNARDDTQSDRARYWLHNVKSFAPDSPVLLVLNKIDQNENASVDEIDLRSRYDKLTQIVRLSAKEFSQKEFNDSFTKVLLNEIQNSGYLDFQWPNSWKNVKEELENMTPYYIMGDAYKAICEVCQVTDNQKNLLNWFNDLGISFCCCEEEDYDMNDYVILRPDWITNALYIILFNKLEGAQNGLIPHKSIHNILKNACKNPEIRCTLPNAKYTSGDIHYVLGIMRKFNLSFSHGTEHEFIPMLCQQNSKADIQYYHRDTETLEFNMAFDYLPNNLLHRLMVERHTELDMDNVWRTGARFQIPELGYSAVVVIDGDTLRFFIRHSKEEHRPNTYLTMLKTNVDRIIARMGLKAPTSQLIYKLEGKREEFEFDLLKEMLEAGESMVYSRIQRKRIPIFYIMNQSAPDGLEDERKLLDSIIRSCQNIQGEPDYQLNGDGHGMEDKRNRRIRDDLYGWGYNIQDQTQRGRSGTGASVGELDFLLYNEKRELWTAIEALRVSDGSKTRWNEHLTRLVSKYNFFGAKFLYHLTYVDADPTEFSRIWNGYQSHIKGYDPDEHTYIPDSFHDLSDLTPAYIKTAKCLYSCGGDPITIYHIFARIPTPNE